MLTRFRAVFRTWTPWEEAVTAAVITRLGEKGRVILRGQLDRVNKVQRIVGWREIDLYVMKDGKVNRGGVPMFFDDREFVLAKVSTTVGGRSIQTSLNCVGGHLFSLESDSEVCSIAFRKDLEIEVIDLDQRFT